MLIQAVVRTGAAFGSRRQALRTRRTRQLLVAVIRKDIPWLGKIVRKSDAKVD